MWQPIDSAPKDGTEIIIKDGVGGIHGAVWMSYQGKYGWFHHKNLGWIPTAKMWMPIPTDDETDPNRLNPTPSSKLNSMEVFEAELTGWVAKRTVDAKICKRVGDKSLDPVVKMTADKCADAIRHSFVVDEIELHLRRAYALSAAGSDRKASKHIMKFYMSCYNKSHFGRINYLLENIDVARVGKYVLTSLPRITFTIKDHLTAWEPFCQRAYNELVSLEGKLTADQCFINIIDHAHLKQPAL